MAYILWGAGSWRCRGDLLRRCAALSAIWNSLLHRVISPQPAVCGGNSSTQNSPAQRCLPTVGEIILMCQLFHGAETWWRSRELNERACCCEWTTNYRRHLQRELRTKCVKKKLVHVGTIRTPLTLTLIKSHCQLPEVSYLNVITRRKNKPHFSYLCWSLCVFKNFQ